MGVFVSKRVEIEALPWDGSEAGAIGIVAWAAANDGKVFYDAHLSPPKLSVVTLEGEMTASPTDWIIKGTEGEFYPCKDSVFQRKYERKVDGDAGTQG